jgi:hypothetical protein
MPPLSKTTPSVRRFGKPTCTPVDAYIFGNHLTFKADAYNYARPNDQTSARLQIKITTPRLMV